MCALTAPIKIQMNPDQDDQDRVSRSSSASDHIFKRTMLSNLFHTNIDRDVSTTQLYNDNNDKTRSLATIPPSILFNHKLHPHYQASNHNHHSKALDDKKEVAHFGKATSQQPSPPNGYSSNHQKDVIDPDVDGGYALIILIVMFLINASTYGTARAYGLIFEKSVREDDSSRVDAAIPFTIMGALENMSGPLAGYLLARSQSWRLTVLLGSTLVCLAHLLAAYFSSLTGRIVTMGIVCGFGTSLITISSFQINNAYFVRYRSRAFGFGLTGAAFGTLYISPLCQHILGEYSINTCYLILGIILLPNVPLSLLLKPKGYSNASRNKLPDQVINCDKQQSLTAPTNNNSIYIIQSSRQLQSSTKSDQQQQLDNKEKLYPDVQFKSDHLVISNSDNNHTSNYNIFFSIKHVIKEPIFHLIWPTQLIFCWFNFVFGMIIVDFAKDRGLNDTELSYLIPTWALGQLVGRLILGAIVDIEFITYKLFTVICLTCIAISTWALQNFQTISVTIGTTSYKTEANLMILLVLILSIFISNLYILFNGLVANYIEHEFTAMSVGISSFITSFFLIPRAHIIGYYRDTLGDYNSMLYLFTCVAATAALVWFIIPPLCEFFHPSCFRPKGKQGPFNSIMSSNDLWLLIPPLDVSKPSSDTKSDPKKPISNLKSNNNDNTINNNNHSI